MNNNIYFSTVRDTGRIVKLKRVNTISDKNEIDHATYDSIFNNLVTFYWDDECFIKDTPLTLAYLNQVFEGYSITNIVTRHDMKIVGYKEDLKKANSQYAKCKGQ